MAPGVFEVTDFESKNIFLKIPYGGYYTAEIFPKIGHKNAKIGKYAVLRIMAGKFSVFWGWGWETIGFANSKSRL